MNNIHGIVYTIDQVSREEWLSLIQLFEDASLSQCWDFGTIFPGKSSHLVCYKNNKVIGIAQIRFQKIPLFSYGVANLIRGPVWQLRGEKRILVLLRQYWKFLKKNMCREEIYYLDYGQIFL
jgi:hypothetical protein